MIIKSFTNIYSCPVGFPPPRRVFLFSTSLLVGQLLSGRGIFVTERFLPLVWTSVVWQLKFHLLCHQAVLVYDIFLPGNKRHSLIKFLPWIVSYIPILNWIIINFSYSFLSLFFLIYLNFNVCFLPSSHKYFPCFFS